MHVDYKLLGQRIAKRRKQLNLTQAQVTEKAELSDKYLSNIETARTIPSIDCIMRICSVLSVTPDYLLVGTFVTEGNIEFLSQITDRGKTLSEDKLKLLESFMEWLLEN